MYRKEAPGCSPTDVNPAVVLAENRGGVWHFRLPGSQDWVTDVPADLTGAVAEWKKTNPVEELAHMFRATTDMVTYRAPEPDVSRDAHGILDRFRDKKKRRGRR